MQQLFCLFTQSWILPTGWSLVTESHHEYLLGPWNYQSVTLTCYQLASFDASLSGTRSTIFSLEGDITSGEVIPLWIWVTVTIFLLHFRLFFLHFGWVRNGFMAIYPMKLIGFNNVFLSNTVFHKCFWLWFAFAEWWFLYTFLLTWLKRMNKY